jgi:hypothetical protein
MRCAFVIQFYVDVIGRKSAFDHRGGRDTRRESGRDNKGSVALVSPRRNLPPSLALSSGKAEQPVHKTHFPRTGFEHEALPLADHAHDLEAFDRRGSRGQGVESAWDFSA